MKYSTEVNINLPRQKAIELFDNPDNIPKWQEGLISMELINGNMGESGAVSKLKYKMGKKDIEMIETIIHKNSPKEFHATYEAKGVWNKVENFFTENEDNTTNWIVVSEFKVKGFMKLMLLFMPGAFKKQTLKFMNHFKNFAENR